MGPNNVHGPGNVLLTATAAILKGMVCKPGTTADTATPCAALTDAAIFVAQEDVASGALGGFAPFDATIEHRILTSANVTAGDKLQIDVANPGKLKTRTTGVGVAVAVESGTYALGIQVRVRPCFTET